MSFVKKFFFASLLIFIVSLLFLGIYRLSFYKSTETANPLKKDIPISDENKNTDLMQKNELAKIVIISDEAVLSPTLSFEGLSIKYYSKKDGHTYEIDLDGTNKKTLSNKDLVGLDDILWSSDKTKVISRFSELNGNIQLSSFDYISGKGFSLNKNITKAIWDASSNKIFYTFFDTKTKKSTLNVSDPDGNNWKKLTDLTYADAFLAPIPQSGQVSFWNNPDNMTQTSLESMPVIGGERKILFKEKFGADYLWNNSGNNILISHSDTKGGSKIQLAIANYNGGEYLNLGIPTFVSKCVWSKDNSTIYYALPGNLPDSAMLPNDYNSGKIKTSDTFWKINLKDKKPERLIELKDLQKTNIQFDASKLFLSSDESYLFFVNKLDGKLYKISL